MKRLSQIWLFVFLIPLLFSACKQTATQTTQPSVSQLPPTADSKTNAQTQTNKPSQHQTIILWHSMSDYNGEAFNKQIQLFNEGIGKEKNITVEAVFQGAYADSTTKMRSILQNDLGNQLPDVMQIDATGVVDYKASKYAFTVDDAIQTDPTYDLTQISKAPLSVWNYDNRQLGMPFSSSTTVMYYNKTLLDSIGVTTPPKTFEEIIDVAAKLPKTNKDGAKLIPYADIPNTLSLANWIGQMPGVGEEITYLVDNKNGRDGRATKLVADEDGSLELFLTEWKNMYDAGALINSNSDLSRLFTSEQLVFFTASTSHLSTLLKTVDNKFEIGCAFLPRVNESSRVGASVSGSGMFMFNKNDTLKTAAAWEVVKFLASDVCQAEFSIATGYFPSNIGSYQLPLYQEYVKQYPQMEVGIAQVEQTSPYLQGVSVGPSRDFYIEIQNQVSSMLEDNQLPQETVISMAKSLNGMLEQYNKANPSTK